MPCFRPVAAAVFLMSLGLSSLMAQQKNPFAEWDSLQKASTESTGGDTLDESELPESPKPSSASGTGRKPGAGTADKNRTASTRQASGETRTAEGARKNSSASGSRPSARTASVRQTTSPPGAEPKGSQNSGSGADPAALRQHSLRAELSDVKSAEFSNANDDQNEIIQVSDAENVSPEVGEDNPFAGLVDKPIESGDSLESDDQAEPLVRRSGAEDRAPEPESPADFSDFSVSDSPASTEEDASESDELAEKFSDKYSNEEKVQPRSAGLSHSSASPGVKVSDESGPQSPGVTMQWVRHGEMNVDQPCDMELVVQNTSRFMVRSVMAEAVLPEGLEVVSVNPKPLAGSSMPSWTFGELKPGEKRSVLLKVIPHQSGDVQMDAFVRLTGFSSSVFSVQQPQIEVAVEGPEMMEVGQQGTFIVRVSNPGSGMASNVLIQAAVPDGLEHRRGSLLTIEIGTLNPGESRQAQLNVTAVKGGEQQMAIRALADGGLTSQTAAALEVAEPELSLEITGPAEQMSGRTEQYLLQVMNQGDVPSANVRAKYRVADGFEFVSADRGGKYNDDERSIEWFVGTLQGGESSRFHVSLRAAETGALLHQAGVISEHGKVTMTEMETSVEGTAVLDLKIVASQNQLQVGDEITYDVEIANTGDRSATAVGFSCELPTGLELVETSGPTEYIAENGVVVFKSLAEIEAGKTAVYSVRARCTREGTHRLRLRAASESISEPLIGEETTIVAAR